MAKRPKKIENLLEVVKEHATAGTYVIRDHAQYRSSGRAITEPEFRYVLRNGWHEKRKDEYKPEYEAWNYAIRGKTIDDRDLRVIVSFDELDMLIITLIDLDAND